MTHIKFAAIPVIALFVFSAHLVPIGPRAQFEARQIEGWTVHVDRDLLRKGEPLGEAALKVLGGKLHDIERTVPPAAVERLRAVPIWVGVEDEHGNHPCACYHPSAEWLEENGYDPAKARSVDIANARTFMSWSLDQPSMVLHELAHAYHHQELGHDNAALTAAYDAAVVGGAYESVLRNSGQRERHYAMNNVQEYFAEGTEAYFGTNDFYPFVRAELREHDPRLYALMETLWRPGGADSPDGEEGL